MDKISSHDSKRDLITICVALLIILVLAASAFLLCSCVMAVNFINGEIKSLNNSLSGPDYCQYGINISGLDNYTGDGLTGILVPIPMIDGEPVFTSDDVVIYEPNWSFTTVSTDRGKMMAIYTGNRNLSRIGQDYRYSVSALDQDFGNRGPTVEAIMDRPLFPVASDTSPVADGSFNYTSYVYIDRNMRPDSENSAIHVRLQFVLGGDSFEAKYGTRYRAIVDTTIPAGQNGMIPVNVSVSGAYGVSNSTQGET